MKFALSDFETASACDLKKSGAWVYAADPTTEVLCLGVTFDGAEPVVYDRAALIAHPALLWEAVNDPNVMFIAHNVAFEKAIWRAIMRWYGYPDIPNERWHDIMAVCAMKGLPLNLDRAAAAMHLHSQKDKAGSKATIALSKVNRKGFSTISEEKLAVAMNYCGSDIHAELELHRAVRGLGDAERRVWLLDQQINERGVRLDMDFVAKAQRIVDHATVPLLKEFGEITGGLKSSSPKFLSWLNAHGCHIPNLQKETIAKYLGGDIDEVDETLSDTDDDYLEDDGQLPMPFDCDRALKIRQVVGSASIKKLAAMRQCVGTDERARGLLQYHGAGPGRWAGRLLQPQNFPRPTIKVGRDPADPDALVAAIQTGDAEYVRAVFGEPVSVVASSLRHTIIASPGKLLTVGDFATIEARIVLALAGQHDKTALIASGKDIYIDMAQTIYHCVVDKKRDPEKRQTGKNTVLGCGFQMGAPKFRARYAPKEDLTFAKSCIDAYRKDFAPLVPKLWYGLEAAAVDAVWRNGAAEAYGIVYRMEDGWLTARLPSGRKLWYRDPQKCRKAMPWDKTDIRPGFTYRAWKMGQWKIINAYGGLLTENVVQATARDMLVHAMFTCEAEGLPIVLTVHDEVVTETAHDMHETLEQIMIDQPQWVKNLQVPVGAETFSAERYRK